MEGYIDENQWIDLSVLPRRPGTTGQFDWKNSVGLSLQFMYKGIRGEVKIIGYQEGTVLKVYIDGYTAGEYDLAYTYTLKQCQLRNLLRKKVVDTNPELIQYLKNKNDAFKHSVGSPAMIDMTCPICGTEKKDSFYNIHHFGFTCPQCSDGVSYPNKMMFNVLKQLRVGFIREISKKYNGFEWIGQYKYDFYFTYNNQKYLIEMDGQHHFKDHFRTYEEAYMVDRIKDTLASTNGFRLIRIDCFYKKMTDRFTYIKNNILQSELSSIFDLSMIDWIDVNKSALKSHVFDAAELWNQHYSILDISHELQIARSTVREYLKVAAQSNMCDYNEETSKARQRANAVDGLRRAKSKPLVIYKDNKMVGCFDNATELSKQSQQLYGINMNAQYVRSVCRSARRQAYGYEMKYIANEEYERLLPKFKTIQNECKLQQEVS